MAQEQVEDYTPSGTGMWVYTPSSYTENGDPSPVLISLHGGSGIANEGTNLNILTANADQDLPSRLIYLGQWDT
ncbi:MAG TPA: hypothetical protein VKZ68_04820, partial [Ohtaekwangia sp.]|nr:hypothetical protein [Ohtaekwangia sp.]